MAQVITTQFKGPTNSRGSRVLVRSWLGSKAYSWDHALNSDENHAVAVGHYVAMLNKQREFEDGTSIFVYSWAIISGGSMPDGKGYGFVIDLVRK